MTPVDAAVEARARASRGASADAILASVAHLLAEGGATGTLVDVGCGTGALRSVVQGRFTRYVGVDAARYDGFPHDGELHVADLDRLPTPLPDAVGDAVVAVETIEHLENPRALVRELVRLAKPGGLVIVTTPNQLSLLSRMTLLLRGEHNAFRDASYPAHITALLEVDLRRIAAECGLTEVAVEHTGRGRIPGTGRHWPHALSAAWPRGLSDNVLLRGRKPRG